MLKGIIGIFIFGLIIIAILILVIINFTYKGIKQLRASAEESFMRKQRQKEQKEKNPFGDDYFKSSDNGSNQSFRGRTQQQYTQQAQNRTARRTTTTSSGVTIIDDRDSEEKRKIFKHGDGEYTEFEEIEN